ncbi:competence type IV pilus major pilin ComGC [Alkalihalophilus marmarensis]|uniref:competence type IV pilus major pilin ComGC n=1 Tax=Alkalihalophilus marmarensis TaxID=521377 RepID=UPI002DBDDD94|nr:competence type IV pilus major pilin ComGC [Alkalihalophilus marmarensis]MEC2073796.1 competence type IV pilus major pilin ComGC [Alkalihalophilus marmarensis]
MKKLLSNERGFTLVEMLVVLMIISILLLIAIPNMVKNNEVAGSKGCDATIKLLQTQVHAYEIETKEKPASLDVLETAEYIETKVCPNGAPLKIENGKVVEG